MKKIFFTGILSILCVSASFAQVKFGVTAGLNVSNINYSGTGGVDINEEEIGMEGIPVSQNEIRV